MTTEHKLTPIWIRGDLPEIGNSQHLVTRSAFEAELWRSRSFVVTQVFIIEQTRVIR